MIMVSLVLYKIRQKRDSWIYSFFRYHDTIGNGLVGATDWQQTLLIDYKIGKWKSLAIIRDSLIV